MVSEVHRKRVEARKSRLKGELDSVLGGREEIKLEIGCGHGHWLTDFAAKQKGGFFFGIDLIGDRIERANRKAERAELDNIAFIKAEASELVELMLEEVAIESVYVLFPDPWPKKRHWKNRLINPKFLNKLAERCLQGCRLYFRTDHEGYFDWALHTLESVDSWQLVEGAAWPFERESVFQAKAENYQSLVAQRCQNLSRAVP